VKYKDIRWFQVTVNESRGGEGIEPGQHIPCDAERARNVPGLHGRVKRPPHEILHGEEGTTVGKRPVVEDPNDVRVLDSSKCGKFLP
jgi:hypothetical protein